MPARRSCGEANHLRRRLAPLNNNLRRNLMRAAMLAGASLALAASLTSFAAFAGPADYVYSPIVEHGEREIDFKYGTAKSRDGTRESAGSVGFGWGVTEHWFTEVYGKWHKEPGDTTGFDAFEWENKFQLTETGKYP